MPNQHKPLPPEELIRDRIQQYFDDGCNDEVIAELLKEDYDTSLYGVSARSVKRLRAQFGLKSTRQQKHTTASISEAVRQIRELDPARGTESMRAKLRIEYGIHAPRSVISAHLKQTEPGAVKARRARRFKRRVFYAAGVADIWAMDQHDKWGPRFGLWLHNGIDPMIGYNNWIKVWWTNKNPRLIASYYIEAVRAYKGIPLTTQSDPGSENYLVANMQTRARHKLDPSLEGTLQHRWKRGKMNTKSEVNWSVFRRDFAPGYEDLFEHGKLNGWYDPEDKLENLVFRWVAIPWLQFELDKWARLRNKTQRRANRKSVLPHNQPELIRQHPRKFGLENLKVVVTDNFIDELEQEYIDKSHPVFQLTPPAFHERADAIYSSIGRPPITKSSFWDIYRHLLDMFRIIQMSQNDALVAEALANDAHVKQVVEADEVPLIEGQAELRANGPVVGDAGSWGGDAPAGYYAEFTDSDPESSDDEGNPYLSESDDDEGESEDEVESQLTVED